MVKWKDEVEKLKEYIINRIYAPLAQLNRAHVSYTWCHWFESNREYYITNIRACSSVG